MNPVGWIVSALLTLAVVGLVVVPYRRALPDSESLGSSARETVRDDIEQALHRGFCLDCGARYERWNVRVCSECGQPREDGPS
jgi:hypothetical protein